MARSGPRARSLADKNRLAFASVLFILSLTACGPQRVALPTGAGTPAPDYAEVYAGARATCDSVRSLQAELALSGRAARQRMRGRVLVGVVSDALRLEGVAPFGSPVFILVADGPRGTLLLLRDRRVLRDAPPDDILEALVGVRLGAADLRALLSGCVKAAAEPTGGRAHGSDWLVVDLASGGTVYLQRRNAEWRIVAGRYGGMEVDYPAFLGDRPSQVVLRGADLNLALGLTQVEVNGPLPREELISVKVTSDLLPLTLDELRKAGPLGP